MVVTLPQGIRFMSASTSDGAAMTTVPAPQRELIFGVIFSTRGKPLLSASFSRHDLRVLIRSRNITLPLREEHLNSCRRPIRPGCRNFARSGNWFYPNENSLPGGRLSDFPGFGKSSPFLAVRGASASPDASHAARYGRFFLINTQL